MANPLDTLIDQQNSPGIGMGGFQRLDERPATQAQITGVRDPNTPLVTVAPNTGVQIEGDFGASGLPAIQADWNRTPADIRRDLTLDILRTRAAQNKFALEEQQQRAPLQDRLLQAKIAATGAHERFMEAQDTDVLTHTAGFLNYLSDPNAPNPDDPEFEKYALRGLKQFPRATETKGMERILGGVMQSASRQGRLRSALQNLPAGFEATKISPEGITAEPISALEAKRFQKDYGTSIQSILASEDVSVGDKNPTTGGFEGKHTGKTVRVLTPSGNYIFLPTKVYEKIGGEYSPETAKARGGVTGSGGGSAGVGDRKAQAQQILNDPDASEEALNAARSFMLKGN